MNTIKTLTKLLCSAGLLAATAASHAVPLTITHFGDGMYGVPFTVALEKGYFKEANVDVTGFLTSEGGGSSVRNTLASEIPYGEVALPAAIAAIKQGLPITIVNSGVQSLADLFWVQLKENNYTSIKDMKGKTMGYSSPKSFSEVVVNSGLERAGMTGQVTLKPVGGAATLSIALQQKTVDTSYMTEPAFSDRKGAFKIAFRATDMMPRATQTVGIVSTAYLKAHPEVIRGIISARRKGLEYLKANREEGAKIMAKYYKLEPAVARAALDNCLDADANYWSTGKFDYAGMDEVVNGLVKAKVIDSGANDWNKIVDESALPANERKSASK
ncbi:MAG: ABC transporter substrate-binding protein [Janthinobacterium lividum]